MKTIYSINQNGVYFSGYFKTLDEAKMVLINYLNTFHGVTGFDLKDEGKAAYVCGGDHFTIVATIH